MCGDTVGTLASSPSCRTVPYQMQQVDKSSLSSSVELLLLLAMTKPRMNVDSV
jgi:hypothetical protein